MFTLQILNNHHAESSGRKMDIMQELVKYTDWNPKGTKGNAGNQKPRKRDDNTFGGLISSLKPGLGIQLSGRALA